MMWLKFLEMDHCWVTFHYINVLTVLLKLLVFFKHQFCKIYTFEKKDASNVYMD